MRGIFSFLLFFLLAITPLAFGKERLSLTTPKGVFVGEMFGGARLFPYIAYAEAPLGKNRWRKVPLENKAKQLKHPVQCPQTGDDTFEGGDFPMQEDCLFMNVWAPPSGEKHPVILWIHGGGFISGNGVQRFYDGSIFTQKGVVFVAFNYRLSEFGFGPNLEKQPGALGLWDQANALNWVIQNIEYFGGDPNNIYLMGHSKGAEAVGALMETGIASDNVKGGIAMSYARHFDMASNHSFPKIQTEFLPGEVNSPWQQVLKMDKKIEVYVPVIPRVRLSNEGTHRFKLLTTTMYDERFWGDPFEMYCVQAFHLKQFYDYIDGYYLVLHPGEYDHGQDVYSLFSQDKLGKKFRDYIVDFVKTGNPPNLSFGISSKPFSSSLRVAHLFPWFSLPQKFHDEWEGVNCVLPKGYVGSQIGPFWYALEKALNMLGYGDPERKYHPNQPLNKDPITLSTAGNRIH